MATRAPFLTQPYGAYDHRDVPQDEELTHVGPGTSCGEYLRRFWQPVALSKQVQDLPLRVRIFGEDLVVFRDQRGRVGCLELPLSPPQHFAKIRPDRGEGHRSYSQTGPQGADA